MARRNVMHFDVDASQIECVFHQILQHSPPRVSLKRVHRLVGLGFLLRGFTVRGKAALPGTVRAGDRLLATFKPLQFMREPLAALRAGHLDFRAFENILKAKRRVWDEAHHD